MSKRAYSGAAFESVDGLRTARGLSARATHAVLTDALGALLRTHSQRPTH